MKQNTKYIDDYYHKFINSLEHHIPNFSIKKMRDLLVTGYLQRIRILIKYINDHYHKFTNSLEDTYIFIYSIYIRYIRFLIFSEKNEGFISNRIFKKKQNTKYIDDYYHKFINSLEDNTGFSNLYIIVFLIFP